MDAAGRKAESNLAEGEVVLSASGVYAARDEADLDRFLAFLGSRIVFLIDWNKARKALADLRPKGGPSSSWPARQARRRPSRLSRARRRRSVFDAVRRAAAGRIAYGVPLDKALGETECSALLWQCAARASEGLDSGRSTRFIRDEIQADLSQRLDTAESELLAVVLRHLGLTRMLAGMIETAFGPLAWRASPSAKPSPYAPSRSKRKGDRLTVAAREISRACAMRTSCCR